MPEAKTQREVIVQSCCEQTRVEIDLSDDEVAVLRRFAEATAAASRDAHYPTVEVVA